MTKEERAYTVTRRDIFSGEDITLDVLGTNETDAAWNASEILANDGHGFTILISVEEK